MKIDEVLERLRKPFPVSFIKESSKADGLYVPWDIYADRLEQVVGRGRFKYTYSEKNIFSVQYPMRLKDKDRKNAPEGCFPYGGYLFNKEGYIITRPAILESVKCRLTITCDDGEIAVESYSSDTEMYDGAAATSMSQAQASAFRSCCNALGIGGDLDQIWTEAGRGHSSRKGSYGSNGGKYGSNDSVNRYGSVQPTASQDTAASVVKENNPPAVQPNGSEQKPEASFVCTAVAKVRERSGGYFVTCKVKGVTYELCVFSEVVARLQEENKLDAFLKWAKSTDELTIRGRLDSRKSPAGYPQIKML